MTSSLLVSQHLAIKIQQLSEVRLRKSSIELKFNIANREVMQMQLVVVFHYVTARRERAPARHSLHGRAVLGRPLEEELGLILPRGGVCVL